MIKWIRNVFIVWFLTGFWHGAAWVFVIWGLYFGFSLSIEKLFLKNYLDKMPKAIRHMYVIVLVIISFMIFNANDVPGIVSDIKGLFFGNEFINSETLYYIRSYGVIFIAGIMGAIKIPMIVVDQLRKRTRVIGYLEPFYITLLLILCTGYIVDGSYNPFLYFRF